jgi:hypothetical protein
MRGLVWNVRIWAWQQGDLFKAAVCLGALILLYHFARRFHVL